MRRLPAGTVTFLFTDIEGSTRLLLELGDRYADVLAEHHRLLREVWARHRGVELETAGDAFFVAFARASDAVAAAAEAQQVLEPTPVRIRVGIHTGEPLLAETGYVGVAVHQAARIASAGHGGQVVISQETRELVDAEVIDLGVHRVKDFPERLRLFQLGKGVFPPLRTVAATNLPRPASTFVGRATELKAVVTLLGAHRLVTLSGPGGSGKTRLAIEAASTVVAEFGNGVYWVPLASLADPTLVLDTIKQVVGAKEDLTAHFAGRRALLLLDNFEQVIDAAPELGSLLSACPELHVLVTSRERLRVQGEIEYAVDPLERAEAVELFCVRAQTEPDELIDELCARLDDLPLALELAAARASAFPAAQILERISGRLDLLKGGRDAEARHATLRETIEWSHELLGVGEQQLFRRLSVFVGGCTLDAAEAVGGADLDTLASLVEKSLARRTGERYWMLETIRAYALERLDSSGEGDALRLAHARFFTDLAVQGDPELRGPRQEEWFERLTTEQGNVRAALEWLADSSEAPLHARLAGSCWYFWYVTGQFDEAHRRLTAALETAVDVDPELVAGLHDGLSAMSAMRGESASALRHAEESLAIRRRGGSRQALLRSLLNRAGLAESFGDFAEASKWYAEVVGLAESVGDKWFQAVGLGNLGSATMYAGDSVRARELLERALALGEQTGDAFVVAAHGLNLAAAELDLGMLEEAKARYADFAERVGAARSPELTLWCLDGLAKAAAHSGDFPRAARLVGASNSAAAAIGYTRLRLEQQRYGRTIELLGAAMSEEELAALHSQGAALSPTEALEYALGSAALTHA
jgi:predicted ATPase